VLFHVLQLASQTRRRFRRNRPTDAGNLTSGIAAVSPAPQPNSEIIPKPPRRNQARRFASFCCSTISCDKLSHWIFALQFIQLTFKRLELRRNSLEQDGRLNSEIFMRQNISHPDHFLPRYFGMSFLDLIRHSGRGFAKMNHVHFDLFLKS